MKNPNNHIGNRTGALPDCSAVTQPTAHRMPLIAFVHTVANLGLDIMRGNSSLAEYGAEGCAQSKLCGAVNSSAGQALYVRTNINIEASSLNHCCRGKAISIAYS